MVLFAAALTATSGTGQPDDLAAEDGDDRPGDDGQEDAEQA
jgi:hypothetical protein